MYAEKFTPLAELQTHLFMGALGMTPAARGNAVAETLSTKSSR
jgi:hypothetical protein